MTYEELEERILLIKSEAEENEKRIKIEYAYSNNPYKVGDIFTDHLGSIIIEKIKLYLYGSKPYCIYIGTVLNKDGTPNKLGNKRNAAQTNELKETS